MSTSDADTQRWIFSSWCTEVTACYLFWTHNILILKQILMLNFLTGEAAQTNRFPLKHLHNNGCEKNIYSAYTSNFNFIYDKDKWRILVHFEQALAVFMIIFYCSDEKYLSSIYSSRMFVPCPQRYIHKQQQKSNFQFIYPNLRHRCLKSRLFLSELPYICDQINKLDKVQRRAARFV